LRQVLTQILPAGAHVRVELKRLKVQIGLNLAVQALKGFFQSAQTHGTPRAGNVRDEVDFQGRHGQLSGQ
jgi:hypothetical protein